MNNEAVKKAKEILLQLSEEGHDYYFTDYQTIDEIKIGFERPCFNKKIIQNITFVFNSNLDFIRIESFSRFMPSSPTEN